ncbi:uncharacterized protein BXZ73DRAFT_107160 [Epithele typhae]|uniref:uncharacterized protein n=1 Tax=Epithele typhae TaxID=378194 RepID=UPI002008E974|nr:uncharacterized protein BXZ73DRAFT_107160 [Epithele typhae]KAH9912925.1 hypothetical protein BXZ73DRAFT_107160 [Epithele typhae]
MSGHARQSFRANPLTPFSGIPGVVENLRSRVDISVAHELERIKYSSFRLTDNEIVQMDVVPPDVPRSASARKWVNDNIERIVDVVHRLGLRQAVVLSGGLLGLQAATAVHDLPTVSPVAIVHRSHQPLSRQLDAQGGDIVRRRIEGMCVRFLGGTFAVRVYTSSPRNPTPWARVIGVELADGTTEPCDLASSLDARVALQDGLVAAVGSLPALRVLVVGILCYLVADPRCAAETFIRALDLDAFARRLCGACPTLQTEGLSVESRDMEREAEEVVGDGAVQDELRSSRG